VAKASGQSCDEYPRASTAQGAAFGRQGINWDVRALNANQNSYAGSKVQQEFSNERFLYGDPFYIDVQP
jgi:hypothetical protein